MYLTLDFVVAKKTQFVLIKTLLITFEVWLILQAFVILFKLLTDYFETILKHMLSLPLY